MKAIRVIAMLLFVNFSWAAETSPQTKPQFQTCESTKEFITVFEFLRSEKGLELTGDLSVKVASDVAKGCSGAAKRFILSVKSLTKTELAITDVIATAKEFSLRDDKTIEAFNSIFRRAFAEDGFDLDRASALNLAKKLSVEYKGNVAVAMSDFDIIADFCMARNNLDLPKERCAELAQRVAVMSSKHGLAVGSKFVETYRYLVQRGGPALTVKDALLVAEQLMKDHPNAADNFRLAYEYATAKRGLAVSREQAILFGKNMAAISTLELKAE